MNEDVFMTTTYTNASISRPHNNALPNSMNLVIVPYFEPSSPDWQTLYEQADANPGVIKYVIINPCSGPCQEPLSEQWQQIVLELKKRDIKTLGYIFDSFQSTENIDYYMKAPNVTTDGIFFDNEGSSNTIERFRPYANYVHDLDGIVYINPGYNYPHVINYLRDGLVDVANVYEFESSKAHHIEVDRDLDPRQLSAILGDVHTVSEMKKMISETAEAGISTVYVYSDSYYNLPPFFLDMVKETGSTKIQSG
ncbi:MAG: hypothetical protein HZC29_05840 [Thaumarchaeota archaeon]|nr:hypothetical protein [Nitrososphaerota archaeon]